MKRFSLVILSFFLSLCVSAREHTRDSVLLDSRYNLSLYGLYGYNGVYGHIGGFDLAAYMPVHKYFEAEAALEYQSPQTCAVSAFLRPKYPFRFGEIFLDCDANFRYWGNYSTAVFVAAWTLGYRFDYVSFQAGVSSMNVLDMLPSEAGSNANTSYVNFTFRLAFNVRPSNSVWNINFGMANYTLYQFESSQQFVYFLGGRYDVGKRLTLLLETEFKPSGIFHMNAHFWGTNARLGAQYRF